MTSQIELEKKAKAEFDIKSLLGDVKIIVAPQETVDAILGFDFIAVGDDHNFEDYLYHADVDSYLKYLDKYFDDNPSLLLLKGFEDQLKSLDDCANGSKATTNTFELRGPLPIPKTQFKQRIIDRDHEYYWNEWCRIIKEFYPDCCSVYFHQVVFSDIQKNTGVFLYFSKDIGPLLSSEPERRGYLKKACAAFMYKRGAEDVFPEHVRMIRRLAAGGAISQVMARNMSHNIGSHVLSKFKKREDVEPVDSSTKQYIEGYYSDPGLAGSQYLAGHDDLYGSHSTSCSHLPPVDYEHKKFPQENHPLENRSQIAYFNKYLKDRMDFLADIATADPVMENALFFYSEVFKGLDQSRVLLSRISGISDENFRFGFNIKFKKTGENPVDITLGNDFQVAMTNDILGAQAFYIIVENIIRNVAKHGGEIENDIVIGIEITEYKNDSSYYEVQIYDGILRRADTINEIVLKRNIAFNKSILNQETNTLRSSDLGTIEMDVCAAYMRRVPIINVELEKYRLLAYGMETLTKTDEMLSENDVARLCKLTEQHKRDHEETLPYRGEVLNDVRRDGSDTEFPKLMFAFRKEHGEPTDDNRYSLGYKFYLQKPKEVLWVVDNEATIPGTCRGEERVKQIEKLKSFGIKIITLDSLKQSLDQPDDGKIGEVFNHQIVLNTAGEGFIDFINTKDFIDTNDEDGSYKYRSRLSPRIVSLLPKEVLFSHPHQLISSLWEKYVANRLTSNVFKLLQIGNVKIRPTSDGFEILPRGCTDNPSFQIHWDTDHAGEFKKVSADYYEMNPSHSWIRKNFQIFSNERKLEGGTNHLRRRRICEYLEVVSCKIVVIDERIQENLANPLSVRQYQGVDLFSYFRQQRVIIPRIPLAENSKETTKQNESQKSYEETLKLPPTDIVNLNVPEFGHLGLEGSVAQQIKCFVQKHLSEGLDFCVIHLGVLEKMLETSDKSADQIESLISELIKGYGSDAKLKIVITSGRGEPDNVPKGIKYIPIAAIQNALETVFDKSVLVKILFNAREIVK